MRFLIESALFDQRLLQAQWGEVHGGQANTCQDAKDDGYRGRPWMTAQEMKAQKRWRWPPPPAPGRERPPVPGVTLQQIANVLGITRERVRQHALKPCFPPPLPLAVIRRRYRPIDIERYYRECGEAFAAGLPGGRPGRPRLQTWPLPWSPPEGMDVGLVVVAGSKAYGLDTPDSDTDYRGFFKAPAHLLVGVNDKRPKDSWTRTDPDITLHEVGKFVSLALAANPTVLEVLAIDPEVSSPLADDLRANLDAFLSDRCRATFGGYAMAQFNRLKNRGDGSFSADTRKRTAKHARHMLRLLQQGAHLLETGELRVRVPNREELFEFGELPLEAMVAEAEDAFARFNAVESVLPATPNIDLVHQILVDHRLGRRRGRPPKGIDSADM